MSRRSSYLAADERTEDEVGEATAVFRVKVNAGSQTEGVRQLAAGYLQVRTRAPAVDGKANRRVLELLADALGVDALDLEIVSGKTRPLKVIRSRVPVRLDSC